MGHANQIAAAQAFTTNRAPIAQQSEDCAVAATNRKERSWGLFAFTSDRKQTATSFLRTPKLSAANPSRIVLGPLARPRQAIV
jgi:hypothetical protein